MGPPSKGFAKELTPALTKRDVSKRAGTWTRNSTKGGDPYAYSRVWSKEAYGGEYHVARSMDGADAMVENAKEVELGYEKPVGGLTTNFVGNHMTQGAIDLVQAELNRPDPYYEARGSARLHRSSSSTRCLSASTATMQGQARRFPRP